MENYIDHGDTMDVNDIAGYIREAGETLESAKVDLDTVTPEELKEAVQALRTYREALAELTNAAPVEDWEDLASDWQELDEGTLIADHYFTEYVMALLEDIGDLKRDRPWYIVIDEEATANNVKMDYTEIDIDGHTYYIRLD